jgi:long-chain acyl-CoA synthetase
LLGAVLAPLNWRQSARELLAALEDADPTIVLWQKGELAQVAAEVRADARPSAAWLPIDDGEYETSLATATPTRARCGRRAGDPVLLLYTAAFDGRPHGALLTHAGLLMQAWYGIHFGGVSTEDVYLNCGPLFHVGTLKTTLATFLAGGTNVFVPRIRPEELCRVIDAERCTGAFLQPPTIDEMVAVNADRRYDLSSLRAKPGPDAWDRMVSPAPPGRFRSGYGQTELGGPVTFLDAERPSLGPAGWPAPFVQVVTLGPDGGVLPPGDVGELAVRGLVVMHGYHARDEETAARQAGRWHRTNDLGRIEADGSVSFVGPKTTLIKSAAENIYPAEVEACLRVHPSVADAAVIGVPDPTWGQSVRAIVVRSAPVTEHDLIAHCRSRIASYKKPRSVVFVSELPRRAGQLDRVALDAAHGGGGYPGTG